MEKNENKPDRITVGQLLAHLKGMDEDTEVIFGNDDLSFYRTKMRGDKLVQIEFNEMILDGKVINP